MTADVVSHPKNCIKSRICSNTPNWVSTTGWAKSLEQEARFYGAQSVSVSSGEYKINSNT